VITINQGQEETAEKKSTSPASPSSLFSLPSSEHDTVSPAELMGKVTTVQAQPSGAKTQPPKASASRQKHLKPKQPELLQPRVMAGSSLTTKQRLAQSALLLTPSTNPAAATASHEKSIPPPRVSSLAGLSFKKTSSAPQNAAASASPILPPPPPPNVSTSPDEPVEADVPVDDYDHEIFESDAKYVFFFLRSLKSKCQTIPESMYTPNLSHEPVPSAQVTEAEQFLSSIMPAGYVLGPYTSNDPDPDFLQSCCPN
jgi:hypothetical protein